MGGLRFQQDPSHLLWQECQDQRCYLQDQRSRERVHQDHRSGARSLAHGSRQVLDGQARDCHAEHWCPRGDKVADKAGNYVFVNGHAVGLSSKLSDFASLAVRMTAYEHTLARLTGKLSNAKHAGKMMVKPPEWQGN